MEPVPHRAGAGPAARPVRRRTHWSVRRTAGRAAALLLALAVASGCGATPVREPAAAGSPAPTATASRPDAACRQRFESLAESIGSKPRQGYAVPIAFESRWSSIENALAYYVTNGSAHDCTDVLGSLTDQTRALERLTASLAPYDVQARALDAKAAARSWSGHHSAKQRRAVAKALGLVLAHVTRAAQDLRPALTQLATVDPGNAAQLGRARKDLDLLARNSTAYLACRQGLRALAKAGVRG